MRTPRSALRSRIAQALMVAGAALVAVAATPLSAMAANDSTAIVGAGSSFAGPEVQQWATDTAKAPYSLNVNFTPSSSGNGRFEFANQTVDYAVTDIEYQPYPYDTKAPTFPFIYVPVTAGGLAFMYNLPGFHHALQLSSYSVCAIMTGGVRNWNDPIIAADNPGVTLPSTAIHAVTRSDLAGTNFVLQEYCIHEQPNLWAAFVNSPTIRSYPGQVSDLSATQPRSDWPLFPGSIPVSGSTAAADTVASTTNAGYITAVETAYALQRSFPVASVKNASGDYTQPTAVDVASALAYATQQPNGTHVLNFDGVGPHVYNPSTYSYLTTPTTGWNSAKGAALTAFVDYDLTLGQQKAPEIGYASLGLSLEQYGIKQTQALVPGATPLTSAERAAYANGDLTPAEVAAGQTTPTPGVVNPTQPSGNKGGGKSTHGQTGQTGQSGQSGQSGTGAHTTGGGTTTGQGAGSGTSGGAGTAGGGGVSTFPSSSGASSGVNPAVSLGATNPSMAFTGANPVPIVGAGAAMVVVGWVVRRRALRGVRAGGDA